MIKQEINKLLHFIDDNYSNNFIQKNSNFMATWESELSQYDYDDVLNKFKEYAKNDNYGKIPTLYMLISGLSKTSNKVDFTKQVIYCDLCHRAFNGYEEQLKHKEKCLSIDYVIKQSKKWFNKELTRKELWEMPTQKFEDRYNKLLKYIYEHTIDSEEKKRIGFIFVPPSPEVAKNFLLGE